MTASTEAQLIALIQDHAESGAKVANELELMNERLERLEDLGQKQADLLARLVAIQEERNAREAETTKLALLRAEASIEDRNARRIWWREVMGKLTVPIVGAVGTILAAAAAYVHRLWVGGGGGQ